MAAGLFILISFKIVVGLVTPCAEPHGQDARATIQLTRP